MCAVSVIVIGGGFSVDKIPKGGNAVFRQDEIRRRRNARIQEGDGEPPVGGVSCFGCKEPVLVRHCKHLLSYLIKVCRKAFFGNGAHILMQRGKERMAVPEKQNEMEALAALMGEQGQEGLAMLRRMQRLQRLIGSQERPQPTPPDLQPQTAEIFARNRQENMISAAIPFLNWEYQKDLYLIVRLMEIRRVLENDCVAARERQKEPPAKRRRKLLGAVQGYLPAAERGQLETILKVLDMQEIMEREGGK